MLLKNQLQTDLNKKTKQGSVNQDKLHITWGLRLFQQCMWTLKLTRQGRPLGSEEKLFGPIKICHTATDKNLWTKESVDGFRDGSAPTST